MGSKNIIDIAYKTEQIILRRYWLLWHNKTFRQELEKLLNITNEKFRPSNPEFCKIEQISTFENPIWEEFCIKYDINEFWPIGNVFEKYRNIPIDLEIIENKNNNITGKLLFWENTKQKDIVDAWQDIRKLLKYYIKNKKYEKLERDLVNFWRDVYWYELHYEKKLKLRETAIKTVEEKPILINETYAEHLLSKRNNKNFRYEGIKELLKIADPNNKIVKSASIDPYDKITKLLYNFGIYELGISKITEKNIPDRYMNIFPPVKKENYGKFIKGEEYYVRYHFYEDNNPFFLEQAEKDEKIKLERKSLREKFLENQRKYYLENREEGKSSLEKAIKSAINRLKKNIKLAGGT